jgi:hypothetical protein
VVDLEELEDASLGVGEAVQAEPALPGRKIAASASPVSSQ